MRWLFLFVLLVNFAYVAWELTQSDEVLDVPSVERDAPKIILLSEIGKDSVAVPVVKVEPAIGQPEAEPVVARGGCFTLGPFKELDKLRAVTRAIKKYVTDASFRSHEEREQEMFWVYLDPLESHAKAKALGRQLKKKKVKDYFIVNSGAKINGISLGHFREKNRAYTHAARIKSLGFKAEIEAIFKTYTIYWLDYELVADKIIPENIFDKHITGKINRLVRACS